MRNINNHQGLHSDSKLPNSFWYFLIISSIIVGVIVYRCSKPKNYPQENQIKTAISKRDSIVNSEKQRSQAAIRKGDSLINLLKTEPWRLEEKDLKDTIIVEYLKNYHTQQ
jgi:hypothetical protein